MFLAKMNIMFLSSCKLQLVTKLVHGTLFLINVKFIQEKTFVHWMLHKLRVL